MRLLTAIKPYLDIVTGLPRPSDGGRDNEWVYMATLLLLLPPQDRAAFDGVIRSGLSESELEEKGGIYGRYPGGPPTSSVDNLIGLTLCAKLSWSGAEQLVYNYGVKHHWCWNGEEPGRFAFKYWYGRFLGVPPFIAMAAGKDVSLFKQALFSISAVATTLSSYGNTSDKCLQHLMNSVADQPRYWVARLGVRAFRRIMTKEYPLGLDELYSIYYGRQHPFTRFAPTHFGLGCLEDLVIPEGA